MPPEPTNRILYTVVEGGTKPESTWITENCSDNVFDAETGEGYLVLNEGVTELQGWYDEDNDISHTIFKDIDWNDEEYSDENIATVVIPTQITSIGYEAFYYCYELTLVTIPNSVATIGEESFSDSGLTSVTIPNSVVTIGDYAFNNCTGLTSVTISNSVTSIGEYAFEGCTSLTLVTIPNSVTSIGEGAFYSCVGLTLITIPNSVTTVGQSVFSYCTGLTSVTIQNSVIEDFMFDNCTGLTSIIISNSVEYIGEQAFGGCTSLESVTIPNSVTAISDYAFQDCTSLASVTCNWINSNDIPDIGGKDVFDNTSDNLVINIPQEANTMDYINKGWPRLTLPNMLRYTATTQPTSTWITNNCSDNVFDAKTGEGYLVLNNGVTRINCIERDPYPNMFNDNGVDKNVTFIIIPSQITSIGLDAFSCCELLESVIIPDTVTTIETNAFSGCKGLKSVEIPNSVTSFGNGVFYNCVKLESITIPDSVTSIDNRAFYGCTKLDSVTCEAITPPTLGNEVFLKVRAKICIVPAGCASAYQASGWANYFTTFTEIQ